MNRCFVCQQCEESVDHLLLHCSKMRVLWELHVEGVSYFFLYSILGATLAPSNIYFSLLIKKKKKNLWSWNMLYFRRRHSFSFRFFVVDGINLRLVYILYTFLSFFGIICSCLFI